MQLCNYVTINYVTMYFTCMGWVPLQMISATILTLALSPGLTGSSPAPGCVSCRYSMIATLWVRVRSEQQF